MKTPLQSEPSWFGLDGVFVIIPVFKWFPETAFLLFGVKRRKTQISRQKSRMRSRTISKKLLSNTLPALAVPYKSEVHFKRLKYPLVYIDNMKFIRILFFSLRKNIQDFLQFRTSLFV